MMNASAASVPAGTIFYPDSDGQPMADNTKQARWIVVLYDNLSALFRDRGDVFVAMNNLWYPVEGRPDLSAAPDVYVVFGRPKGDRGSYKQWEEDNIPLTVVFEILSPGNDAIEMDDKLAFYEEHGVEEYYLFDPDTNRLKAFVRRGEIFRRVRSVAGVVSPRLGVRFDLSGPELIVRYSDGRPFITYEEVVAERERAEQRAKDAEGRAKDAEGRAARLAELSRKVLRQEATAEELLELQRVIELPPPGSP